MSESTFEQFEQTEEPKIPLELVKERLKASEFELHQDTEDLAQLNPYERMLSIEGVWSACRDELGDPKTAVDAGCGFGYGTVFLESQGVSTIGVENIGIKVSQGKALFHSVGVDISEGGSLDFSQTPKIITGNFSSLEGEGVVDLITFFYLSIEMLSDPKTFETCTRLVKQDGRVLFATQAPVEEVSAWINANKIPFTYKIIQIPSNFEQTAILMSKELSA